MVHFLNVIILQVRVPVLSENKYFTYAKKKYVLNLTEQRKINTININLKCI